MKLSLLLGVAILSVGWALSESRPTHQPPEEDPPRQAREAPPLPEHPPPPPLPSRPLPPPLPAPKHETLPAVAKISGRIVDPEGNPVGDAKADLDLGDVCIWIYTDAEGNFSAQVAPGDYTIGAVNHDDAIGPLVALSLHAGDVREVVLTAEEPTKEEDVE